jgi:electron transfer flavoprotein alpha subunit
VTVLCLTELEPDGGTVTDASLRALAFSRSLAGPAGEDVAAAVLDAPDAALGSEARAALAAAGVRTAHVADLGEAAGYAPLAWARALAELASTELASTELASTELASTELASTGPASAVVAAGTDHGQEVLAHLGAITGLPMAANCLTAARGDGGQWRLTRQRWAGSLTEEAVLDGDPALLTVATDAVAPAPAGTPAELTVAPFRPLLSEGDLTVRATVSAERGGGVSLATARVVVGGGRGVGGPDGFGPLEELAGLLGGALGVSRVVTSQGWRPHRQQVGQTGTRITPELYLACGISGAIQHMAGCLSAKNIVVVNTDPDAPILAHAQYAVIGDLGQVIPALVEALRARQNPVR